MKEQLANAKNHKEIGKLEMTRELAISLSALGMIALVIFGILFSRLYALFAGINIIEFQFSIKSMLIAAFLIISTLIFHELIHGMFISKYGGTPHYGAGIFQRFFPYSYATSNTTFQRNQYIVIALAPLVVISLVGIIIMVAFTSIAYWMLLPLTMNSSGAVGDLWMISILLRFPKHVLVEDNITGLTVYGKQSDNPLNISIENYLLNFMKGFAVAFIIVFLTSLIFLNIFSGTDGFVSTFSFEQLLASGFAGLAYSSIKSAKTKKRLRLVKLNQSNE